MGYKLAEDAKPQVILLIIATVITIVLWFIPFADYLVYPIRLFVTFIHEASHALIDVAGRVVEHAQHRDDDYQRLVENQ